MKLTKIQLEEKLKQAEAELSAEREKATYTVSRCSITNNSAANKHTREAVIALAEAIKANAEAVIAAANALKGSAASIGTGIHLGAGNAWRGIRPGERY